MAKKLKIPLTKVIRQTREVEAREGELVLLTSASWNPSSVLGVLFY